VTIPDAAYARLFDMGLDMQATADAGGRLTHLNRAWETTLGWSRQELMRVPLCEFLHPDDQAATASVHARVSQVGFEIRDFESRYRCRDGTYRWLSWHATTDGERWFASARDVTEAKARDAQRTKDMTLVQAMLLAADRHVTEGVAREAEQLEDMTLVRADLAVADRHVTEGVAREASNSRT
jgi:PAS domain S-box-containing protein